MTAATAQQLGLLFQQQITGAEQLYQLLKRENEALVKRDADAIQNISQQKSAQSVMLEQLAGQQRQLLQEAGVSFTPEGLKTLLNTLTPALATQLRKRQQQLQSLLEQCQNLNMVNGNIIAANKHSAETALAILRGQLAQENLTYSAGGQAVAPPPSRPIIKA